jgi:hypothetical protein
LTSKGTTAEKLYQGREEKKEPAKDTVRWNFFSHVCIHGIASTIVLVRVIVWVRQTAIQNGAKGNLSKTKSVPQHRAGCRRWQHAFACALMGTAGGMEPLGTYREKKDILVP